ILRQSPFPSLCPYCIPATLNSDSIRCSVRMQRAKRSGIFSVDLSTRSGGQLPPLHFYALFFITRLRELFFLRRLPFLPTPSCLTFPFFFFFDFLLLGVSFSIKCSTNSTSILRSSKST